MTVPACVKSFLEVDLNRGIAIGIGAAVAFVVALWLVKLILRLTVWSHRCPAIKVKNPAGDIVISRQAVAEAIGRELDAFPELKLLRLRIFKYSSGYRIALNCEFLGTGGLPELANRVRPRLKAALLGLFGIDDLSTVDITIERFSAPLRTAREDAPALEEGTRND